MKVGIDSVDVGRFREKVNDKSFWKRIYTAREQAHINEFSNLAGVAERMAGKFAAKEAVSKMLGIGIDKGIKWTDIEILPNSLGKPTVNLTGFAKEQFSALKLKEIDISITHTAEFATAICVAN